MTPTTTTALLERHVRSLTTLSPPRCYAHPESLEQAARYIRVQWEAVGAAVQARAYPVYGQEYRNLHLLLGSPERPRVIIGAHYDVFGDNPGADDNASGVAVLIELGCRLHGWAPTTAVELVAYTLEESPPLPDSNMGSARHAKSLLAEGRTVIGMLSLEMLGYFSDEPHTQKYPIPGMALFYPHYGNFIAVVGRLRDWPLIRVVRRAMSGASPVPVRSLASPITLPGISDSDHRHFWNHGWRAAMITDTAYYRNPNYHRASDTADALDYVRMAQLVDAIEVAVRRLTT